MNSIRPELFSVEIDGVTRGSFYEHRGEERGEWVVVEARDIAFHPPSNSSEYSAERNPFQLARVLVSIAEDARMVAVHAVSEAGGHPVNEDAYLVRPHPASAECWLCCLADGQGGSAGGGRAARLACQTVMDAACRTPVGMLAGAPAWGFLLRSADEAVAADREAGLTTLVGFCVRRDRVVGASCGDSAVLLVGGGGTTVLTAEQVKNPPVGSGAAGFAEFAAELAPDWAIVAMSDGVWKYCRAGTGF